MNSFLRGGGPPLPDLDGGGGGSLSGNILAGAAGPDAAGSDTTGDGSAGDAADSSDTTGDGSAGDVADSSDTTGDGSAGDAADGPDQISSSISFAFFIRFSLSTYFIILSRIVNAPLFFISFSDKPTLSTYL